MPSVVQSLGGVEDFLSSFEALLEVTFTNQHSIFNMSSSCSFSWLLADHFGTGCRNQSAFLTGFHDESLSDRFSSEKEKTQLKRKPKWEKIKVNGGLHIDGAVSPSLTGPSGVIPSASL